MKAGSFQISHDAEVAQGTEAASQAFGQLKQTVDGFNGSIGEAGFEESHYGAPMLLDTDRQIPKGFKPAEFGAFAPPSQGGFIFGRQDVLKHVTQADGQGRAWDKGYTESFFAGTALRSGSIHYLGSPRASP
jgi:hypothetical protein